MKNILPVLLLLAASGLNTEAICQNSSFPSLGKLMRWANNLSYATVHQEVKGLGFKFDGKEDAFGGIDYSYSREIDKDDITYTEPILVSAKEDKVYRVEISASRVDLIGFYTPSLEANKFQIFECSNETDENELDLCYQTKSFSFRMIEKSKQYDDGKKRNGYTVIIYKR